jgi:quinol monooxygenase YgiN
MAGFVQIIEWKTSRIEEVEKLQQEFQDRPDRSDGPSRITVVSDRDRENTYLTIVEFESYDVAMANSQKPATSEFASRMTEVCDGPPTFYNLDVIASEVMG